MRQRTLCLYLMYTEASLEVPGHYDHEAYDAGSGTISAGITARHKQTSTGVGFQNRPDMGGRANDRGGLDANCCRAAPVWIRSANSSEKIIRGWSLRSWGVGNALVQSPKQNDHKLLDERSGSRNERRQEDCPDHSGIVGPCSGTLEPLFILEPKIEFG